MAQFPTREAEIAAAKRATSTKDEALEALTDAMKADLRYPENTVNFDDDKLKLLGWGGRKAGTSLEPPGQARTLEAPREGEGRKRGLYQASESPSETGLSPLSADGGKVASYKIERRERPEGRWSIAGTAMDDRSSSCKRSEGDRGHADQPGTRQGIRIPYLPLRHAIARQQSRRRHAQQHRHGGVVRKKGSVLLSAISLRSRPIERLLSLYFVLFD